MKNKLPLWVWGVVSIISVVVVGILDWLTGYELAFFALYFLPVSVGAWFFGLLGAVGLALFSAVVWFVADFHDGHAYSSWGIFVWNSLIRLVSFLAIGWALAKVRDLLDREREVTEALRKSLSEIKVLESFLPICAQCKKIRDQQGLWQQLEVYIGQHSNTQFTHSYCPECAGKTLAQLGLKGQTKQGG
ncbi:hypothetical protein [Candidatus Nitronereus thalassa]|uniref:MFS transporter n=1 Tax=Candidatus Nitronereus thalassa TaxID=3020898 RepID=A0ABU3KC29_9BACT|nr:hypothetical protein [Candidatus Nitronereus thalassa]MDT7043980.1 hypothetical protein [Candidatus Nitronereus thalassa]